MSTGSPSFDNRITRLLDVDYPIANAPMGGVAGPALIAAVVEAGAIGLIPGSVGAVHARALIHAVRKLTNRPFGVNIPVSFSDASIVDMLCEEGIRFVTTSTGPVPPYTRRLKEAGITVFHVVTSLDAAERAADAGVDGLIVEGSEGGGLRGAAEISMMVLLPLVTSRIDLPVIAAGGIADGRSMAAAFALGAEGVQMGTRMLASTEAAVHANLKQAVVAAVESDTIMINRHNRRPLRVLKTRSTERYEASSEGDPFRELMPAVIRLYQEGDMDVGFLSLGEVSGRVEGVLSAAEIIRGAVEEFGMVVGRLANEANC